MSYPTKQRLYPIFKDGRFYNFEGERKSGFFISSLYMMLKSNIQRKREKNNIANWVTQAQEISPRSQELKITWIGHSTFLIQMGGLNIITDPIFDSMTPFFPRAAAPGIGLANLPEIDIVIISHNHRDHMDARALYGLKKHSRVTFLVPQADKAWFTKRGFERVHEFTWWERQYFQVPGSTQRVEFTFLPAKHWSQRGIFDYNTSLWGSWMMSYGGQNVYFAGDTAYWQHFKAIADEFDHIDVALMPIGPCEPRQWMKYSHIGAEEAVMAYQELRANHFIPMHWGTYYLGADDFIMPIERLERYWNEQGLAPQQLHALKFGQSFTIEDQTILPLIQPSEQIIL